MLSQTSRHRLFKQDIGKEKVVHDAPPFLFLGMVLGWAKRRTGDEETTMTRYTASGRATDIADLEKMLNDGESDAELCKRSIEIFERLKEEERRVRRTSNSAAAGQRIKEEVADFEQVIRQIENRRHEHALDAFKKFLDKRS